MRIECHMQTKKQKIKADEGLILFFRTSYSALRYISFFFYRPRQGSPWPVLVTEWKDVGGRCTQQTKTSFFVISS